MIYVRLGPTTIFKTDRTLLNPEREQNMKQTIADIRNCFRAVSENITEFEYDEVYDVCKKLKNNKSTGLDKVSYEHVNSILFNNKLSRWFQLQRGVRQGGVLSAVLLSFINDLLIELNKTSYGTILYDVRVACSVQADDIALDVSYNPRNANPNNICQLFSERWAFKFSSSKSHVLLYGKCQRNTIDRFFLYGSEIPIVKSTKHVGILLESSFNSMEQTINACHMLRATTISIMNSGVHPAILNTSTCLKIVNQLAYTRALYGCELWNNLTKSELLLLERAHRFVCKAVQGLPKRSRSDKCTSLLGWLCIECYIDKCKLLFFGRLCRLNSTHLPKQIMMARLLEFKYMCGQSAWFHS
ncbi:unnamed protein product [Mytilus edulis]|uniref:Reverse transcriptase domain-containing protein n=1 Tax=Mytilus edulis TaxID=6550 RepID=A0A8S3SZV0_MYTED|nr:unnamed protein product [Mytilus edulis]